MNITIISLVFPPETGSARRVGELAQSLAGRGHRVSVVTGFPSYPRGVVFDGYHKSLMQRSRWDAAVDLIRVYLYTSPKRSQTRHRLLHYLTFTATATLGMLAAPRPDVIYVISPPYFLGFPAWLVARLRGARLALDVQDFWPEAPIALGYVRNRGLASLLLGLERFIYRGSAAIFALSDEMKARIVGRGVSPAKVERVYNWVDLNGVTPVADGRLRVAHGLEGKFVVLFAGNMGRAQGLDMVIDAAGRLRNTPEVVFALLGAGPERARLQARVAEMELSNVVFMDAVAESAVPAYLSMADALLVTLGRAPHRVAALPSKIQVYMAAARPLLVAAEGAAARVVAEAGCGLIAEPDDPAGLADAVLRLAAMSPETRMALGGAGRRYAQEHFERERQITQIEERLRQVRVQAGA